MHVHPCPVCESEGGCPRVLREMLLGTREEFLYFECPDCGCLFLAGEQGSSEASAPPNGWMSETELSSLLRKVGGAFHPWPSYIKAKCLKKTDLAMLRRARLKKNTTLLDMGPGGAARAEALRELGYDAHGIDTGNVHSLEGICRAIADREWLNNFPSTFDVVLLWHSLERLPVETLALARKLLRNDGCCIARIVLLGWAWRTYGTDWGQLDAPRHRLIHSRNSFSLLARKSGFRIDRVVFDSTEFQIWASDTLQRNVPLIKMPSPSRSQRVRMRRVADTLNVLHQGDTAQFYLTPI
jgi:hypothetical protein